MAKLVIAGSSNCPYFAKLELLADELTIDLPHFQVHKIMKPVGQWSNWLEEVCHKNEWRHVKSPIVWRELVDRGGKGVLIGGFNEFMEYAQCYYGVTSSIMTDLMLKMREENEKTSKERAEEEEYYKSLSNPIHVCVTNASCPTAYNLVASIASGEIFGKEVEISIRLLDNKHNMEQLKGVEMELLDLAYPLLRQVTSTSDPEVAFKNTTAVFILDEVPFDNKSRQDWLKSNAELFEKYAEILNDHALTEVKVIVAGNGPVNFNTHVLIGNATNISKQNIVASSRLQERRSRAVLAKKLNVNSMGVKDAIVWGDCAFDGAGRTHADITMARCHGYDGAVWGPEWFSRSVLKLVHDRKWLSSSFLSDLENHDSMMNERLKHEPSLSSASALSSLMRDWFLGTGGDEIYSLGVESEGWYGVKGCVYSLPVKFTTPGSYQVVWDLKVNEKTQRKLNELEVELKKDIALVYPDQAGLEEKVFGETAGSVIGSPGPQAGSPSRTPGGDKLEIIQEESEGETKQNGSKPEKSENEIADPDEEAGDAEEDRGVAEQ